MFVDSFKISDIQRVNGKIKSRITKIADLTVEYLIQMGLPKYEIFQLTEQEYEKAKQEQQLGRKLLLKPEWEKIVVGGIAFHLDHKKKQAVPIMFD